MTFDAGVPSLMCSDAAPQCLSDVSVSQVSFDELLNDNWIDEVDNLVDENDDVSCHFGTCKKGIALLLPPLKMKVTTLSVSAA